MSGFIDIQGNKYGRLTVLYRVKTDKPRGWWMCLCECGNYKIASSYTLKRGSTQSCGCLQKERGMETNTKHGDGKRKGRARLYRTWSGIKQRTSNKKYPYYDKYGGRGITLCDEWKDYKAFKTWANGNGYADDLFIDRIDNSKGYYPENCRWVTRFEQQNNLRCNIRYCFSDGKVLTKSKVALNLGVSKRKVNRVLEPYIVEMKETDNKSHNPHLLVLSCTSDELSKVKIELEKRDGTFKS